MICCTFLIAAVGMIIAKKLSFPVPYLLGAMLATGIFNIFTAKALIPDFIGGIDQIINGTFVGAMVNREDINSFKNMLGSSLLTVGVLLTYGISLSFLFAAITPYDHMTVLFSCAPGG